MFNFKRRLFEMARLVKILLLASSLSCFYSCGQKSGSNPVIVKEKNVTSQDAALIKRAFNYRTELAEQLGDTIPNEDAGSYYYLILDGSFGEGTTVKFVKGEGGCFLCVKHMEQRRH